MKDGKIDRISKRMMLMTAGMGYGWGVRINDEPRDESEDKDIPHLELPLYPEQRGGDMREAKDLVIMAKSLISENNGLDGMTKIKARRYVNDLIRPYTKGLFRDTYWEPVNKIWKALLEAHIDFTMTRAEYIHGNHGSQQWLENKMDNIGKEWKFEINFTNENGRPSVLYGVVVASWGGPISDPSSVYDLTAYVT